ncbi:MAG: DUF3467 domain-containing protein [Paramuribaculum sp.]|nr:DUF3467 domain-containing protein [Paramuribaculum sp.]MDE6324415.1 DUF3467 domain-containing protein [Paramuribaculum sp.]MDE6488850.1 DUF3467 domain-containing protein [Paramuribaculum sp.]
MENKKNAPTELKIELTPDVAKGIYSNLAVLTHGPAEFFLDFITVAPNMPQAKVQARIVMTPENAKNLLMALNDNVKKYEATFGEIERKLPKAAPQGGNGELPNPFIMGGNA